MQNKNNIAKLVGLLIKNPNFTKKELDGYLKIFTRDNGELFSRDEIILELNKNSAQTKHIVNRLKLKPTRTISGVTTVTVLTMPFACPGKCIFCPNDVRMPKSYIASEPGAQRALMFRFDPFTQVYNRLLAYKNIGHPTDKVELLVLGGTWSYYPEKYRVWFIKECFRAMNLFGTVKKDGIQNEYLNVREYLKSDYNKALRDKEGDKPYNQLIQTKNYKKDFEDRLVLKGNWKDSQLKDLKSDLVNEQNINSNAQTRCVGLVLETRPDCINKSEVYSLRELGATKIQLGVQTLDDSISILNKRGETRSNVESAFSLLRAAGFKIHAHIMPNLYGATPEKDFEVYKELFDNPDFKPDELKIYPTSIIRDTENYTLFKEGKYKPYTLIQLSNLLADCIEYTPEYCRLTRIIRDIPSQEIEGGNKVTNLRQVVEKKLKLEKRVDKNIRAREIKNTMVTEEDLFLDILEYQAAGSKEYFLQFITQKRKIAGFLRLSIPKELVNPVTPELDGCAIIREVHVYGPSLELQSNSRGEAQHLGLGTRLIDKAKSMAIENGFNKIAVISSIGTREYYKKRGFELKSLYHVALC